MINSNPLESFEWLRLTISFPTTSIKIMWLLAELKVPFKVIPRSKISSQLEPEKSNSSIQIQFLNIQKMEHMDALKNPNPFQKVPCLEIKWKGEEEKQIIFESNAIIHFLLEIFDKEKRLAPQSNTKITTERNNWMLWCSSTLEHEILPTIDFFLALLQKQNLNVFNKEQLVITDEEQLKYNQMSKLAREVYLPYLENFLSKRTDMCPYFFGKEFDVIDICLGFCLRGCETCNLVTEKTHPHSTRYHETLAKRESYAIHMKQMMDMLMESFQ